MEQQDFVLPYDPGPPFPGPEVGYVDSFREVQLLHWLPLGVQVQLLACTAQRYMHAWVVIDKRRRDRTRPDEKEKKKKKERRLLVPCRLCSRSSQGSRVCAVG